MCAFVLEGRPGVVTSGYKRGYKRGDERGYKRGYKRGYNVAR